MAALWNRKRVQSLCGTLTTRKGEASCRAGQVSFIRFDREAGVFEAQVGGSDGVRTSVRALGGGEVEALCSCPALGSYDKHCHHIAAVMLSVIDRGGAAAEPKPDKRQAADGSHAADNAEELRASGEGEADSAAAAELLELFGERPLPASGARPHFETRAPLDAAFVVRTVEYGADQRLFVLELKLGAGGGRLHPIADPAALLEAVERRESFRVARSFLYEPDLHSFREAHDGIVRLLIGVLREERVLRALAGEPAARRPVIGGRRTLAVPPAVWRGLLPLLAAAPGVQVEQDGRLYDGLAVVAGPLPVRFRIEPDEAEAGAGRLAADGLDGVVVMEDYGAALCEGRLTELTPDACRRLASLQRTLAGAAAGSRSGTSGRKRKGTAALAEPPGIRISSAQLAPFMERVVPGLMKLGAVRVAQAVSDRLVHAPLQARLYLDRVRDRLLGGLEFQYGELIINPLEGTDRLPGARMLVRDGEKERRILELMDGSAFARTDAGYIMADEDGEFTFLNETVPQLEKLAKVYATSAVRVRLFTGGKPPRISVNVDERTDWLEIKFELDGIPEAEIRAVLKSLEEKRRYHRLSGGAMVPLNGGAFRSVAAVLDALKLRGAELTGPALAVPAVRGLALLDLPETGPAVRIGSPLRRLLEHLRNPEHGEYPVPEPLIPVLRDYQVHGFQWMKTLARYGFGGILADDMGLGKTVQSIAFLLASLPEIRESGHPALIVAPASLLYNWRSELNRFAPELRAVIADGTRAARSRLLADLSAYDAVIVSYPLLRRDIADYAGRTFHTLLLDEAQAFKNADTQTADAAAAIRARHRFALTGTPVENGLEELRSIYAVVFPGLFPDRKAFGELSAEAVARRARPFLLRRLKADVLKELPDKIETTQLSELLPAQKKLYVAYLARLRQETFQHLEDKHAGRARVRILAGLTRLRQLICHPALFVEGYAGSSAKLEQLLELVEECRSAGRRMLVFSQFTGMLGLIARELGARGLPFFYLDGATPPAERVALCARFNGGERDLFLISLKAGGTGLNLTGADTVILYDLWWNPAVERQAEDRAHRMGQKRVVQVIRMVARGTVEEKMIQLQQRKTSLIEDVIRPGDEGLAALSEQELRELLAPD